MSVTLPRNVLLGPGVSTIDASASKAFVMPYREGHQLQFRAECFNVCFGSRLHKEPQLA